MAKLVPITSANYNDAYYVNYDTMMGYVNESPAEQEAMPTEQVSSEPVSFFEDEVDDDSDDIDTFTQDVQLFTVEDFNAEQAIKNFKTDRTPSGITQKNITGAIAGIQAVTGQEQDPLLSLGGGFLGSVFSGKEQKDVLGISGLNSYRPNGAAGAAWDLSMKMHANNIAANGEYIKIGNNIVTWNDNTFGVKGMRTYTGNTGGLSAGQLTSIVAAQKRTDLGNGIAIAYSADQYRADKEDKDPKLGGAGLTGDLLAIDVVDPRVISGEGRTTVYMKGNGVLVDATGRRLNSIMLGGAANKRIEELGLSNLRDSLKSGASSMLGTRKVDNSILSSFQVQLDEYAKSVRIGAKYDSTNQFTSSQVQKILDRSSMGVSPDGIPKSQQLPSVSSSTSGSSGDSGSSSDNDDNKKDRGTGQSSIFKSRASNQPTSQADFEKRMKDLGFGKTYKAAYGGDIQKFAPGGDVQGQPNNLSGPVGFVGDVPENVPKLQTVADDVKTQLPEDSFVISAASVEEEGSRDIKNMIVDAIKYARQNEIYVPDMPAKMIDVAISKGEVVIPPELKRVIGEDRLKKINNRGKREVARRLEESETQAADGGFIKKNVGGVLKASEITPEDDDSVAPTSIPKEGQKVRNQFAYENTPVHAITIIKEEVQNAGLPPEFSAMLIGNAYGESALKSRSRQKLKNKERNRINQNENIDKYLRSKTAGKAFGLFQFDGEVKTGFVDYLEKQGVNVSNFRELELAANDARNQIRFILDDAFNTGKVFGPGNAKKLKEDVLNAKTDRERVELLYRKYLRPAPVRKKNEAVRKKNEAEIKKNEAEIQKNVDKRTNILDQLNNLMTPESLQSDPVPSATLRQKPVTSSATPTPKPPLFKDADEEPKGIFSGFLGAVRDRFN